ncbi:RNA methyltransferase [Flavobacteriaceae bacterium]|nr:RNA methyltransferase [Flavobacteriaceae bacterium]
MISNSEIKLITSLQQKKYRALHESFVAEGEKLIRDLWLSGMIATHLFTTSEVSDTPIDPVVINERALHKISSLKNANGWLAVFRMPEPKPIPVSGLILALDGVRDPGNLGTILRLCDWYGVGHVVCSCDTVDLYNPKVVQASMGSIARVQLHYQDLPQLLAEDHRPVFGAFLEGTPIQKTQLPSDAILVMGSEAHGLRSEVSQVIEQAITIARNSESSGAESLNVAMATGIILHEWFRG